MGTKILVVEDDPVDAQFILRALDSTGYDLEIETAANGREALEKLAQPPRPLLILLDLNMPVMDGRELLRTIKADDALRRIPTIVLSTADSQTEVDLCYDAHANAYLVKPDTPGGYRRLAAALVEFWLTNVAQPG